jgi:hypothetical protein
LSITAQIWGHYYLLEESERTDGIGSSRTKKTELRDYQRVSLHNDEEQWELGLEEGVKSSMTIADGVAQMTTANQPRLLAARCSYPPPTFRSTAPAPLRVSFQQFTIRFQLSCCTLAAPKKSGSTLLLFPNRTTPAKSIQA